MRKNKVENCLTVCRIGKRGVNSYADRYRAPIASPLLYGSLCTSALWGYSHRKLSWWHLTSFSHSNFESDFLTLRKPSAYLCELWSPLTHLKCEKRHINGLIPCRMWEKKRSCVFTSCMFILRQRTLAAATSLSAMAPNQCGWQHSFVALASVPENSHMGNGDQIM